MRHKCILVKISMRFFLAAGRAGAKISTVPNRTQPKTVAQWIRYLVVAMIALFLVWWMLRLYVL